MAAWWCSDAGVAADVDGLAAADGRPGQWRTDWWRQHGSDGDFGKKIAKHFSLGYVKKNYLLDVWKLISSQVWR